MRRREATAPALDDVKAVAGHVIADATADARRIGRATHGAGWTHEGGSLPRMATRASLEGGRPRPRKALSLSVRSPALGGRGATRPSSAVGTISSRAPSRPKALA